MCRLSLWVCLALLVVRSPVSGTEQVTLRLVDWASLDEAEMTLQVDQSGTVKILLADVGGKVSGGICFKWKRIAKKGD